jgi:gamma-glutamyltranspeptidase/glutathione hydrolase
MGGRSPVYAPNGIAATSQPLATTAALNVLQRGGNAIDAAVTAAAVLGVVEPMMTGIGGDMFAIIWSARDRQLTALNASGRAGSLMTREELVRRGRTRNIPRGVEAITVPSGLAGWQALLDKYGTITLAQALEPAIRYADSGFVLTPVPPSCATTKRQRPATGSPTPTSLVPCARSPGTDQRRCTGARLGHG